MQDVSVAELLLRLVVTLGLILGVCGLAAKVVRRRARSLGGAGTAPRGSRTRLEVLARTRLGKNATVSLVRAGGETLLIGATDSSVSVLQRITGDDLGEEAGTTNRAAAQGTVPPGSAIRSGRTWKGALDDLRERTVRRA